MKTKVYLKEKFITKVIKANIDRLQLAKQLGMARVTLGYLLNRKISVTPKNRKKIMEVFPNLKWDNIFEIVTKGE